MWWSCFLRLTHSPCGGIDRNTAGLDCGDLKQGSQLLQETPLKLEHYQPLFLLVKPNQILPPRLGFLTVLEVSPLDRVACEEAAAIFIEYLIMRRFKDPI